MGGGEASRKDFLSCSTGVSLWHSMWWKCMNWGESLCSFCCKTTEQLSCDTPDSNPDSNWHWPKPWGKLATTFLHFSYYTKTHGIVGFVALKKNCLWSLRAFRMPVLRMECFQHVFFRRMKGITWKADKECFVKPPFARHWKWSEQHKSPGKVIFKNRTFCCKWLGWTEIF